MSGRPNPRRRSVVRLATTAVLLLAVVVSGVDCIRLAAFSMTDFDKGSVVLIAGQLTADTRRLAVNLMAGKDVAFHFNPRLDIRKVYRNAKINGTWGKEEFDSVFPFAPEGNFTLLIVCQRDGYKVFVESRPRFFFAHRMATDLVDKVVIDSDSDDVQLCEYGQF